MTAALTVIPDAPETFALAESEPRVREWIESIDDLDTLQEARRRLDALRTYYDRGSEDALAARRLSMDAERRMGTLVPAERTGRPLGSVTGGHSFETPPAERKAVERARSLAAVPDPVYEAVRASPQPSRAAAIRAASDDAWDGIVERLVSPETLRLSAIDRWIAAVMEVSIRFDQIDPPPTADEAGPSAAALQSMLRRISRDGKRIEVVK